MEWTCIGALIAVVVTLLVVLCAGCSRLWGGGHRYGASPGDTTVTMAGRKDGFGAQLQALLAVTAAARHHGTACRFAPIRVDPGEHETDSEELALLLSGFEENLGAATSSSIPLGLLDAAQDASQPGLPPGFADTTQQIHWGTDPDRYYTPDLLQELRAWYMVGAGRLGLRALADKGACTAVHIRRGDVQSNVPLGAQRYVPMHVYEALLEALLRRDNSHVHIFSEGDPQEFESLRRASPGRVTLHLEGSVAVAFHAMVTATTLVTARSSLSYAAALLREGPVLYCPFWHAPLRRWLRVEEALGVKIDFW